MSNNNTRVDISRIFYKSKQLWICRDTKMAINFKQLAFVSTFLLVLEPSVYLRYTLYIGSAVEFKYYGTFLTVTRLSCIYRVCYTKHIEISLALSFIYR